jgi:hypothetical protein
MAADQGVTTPYPKVRDAPQTNCRRVFRPRYADSAGLCKTRASPPFIRRLGCMSDVARSRTIRHYLYYPVIFRNPDSKWSIDMNHQHLVRLAVACSFFMTPLPATADEPQSTSPVRSAANLERTPSPDIDLRRTRASRDPVTGRIEISPGSGTRTRSLSPREQNMLSRSDEGLQPTVLANGAVTVNLRGRFQSMATASSESGKTSLKISCSVDAGAKSSGQQVSEIH